MNFLVGLARRVCFGLSPCLFALSVPAQDNYEIQQWGRWYFAVNPAFEKSLHGSNSSAGWDFAPSAKVSFDVTKLISTGVEYYADLGEIGHFDNAHEQQHQLFPTLDLNFSPEWEFNFGVGFGLTRRTDDLMVKLIVGRRF
jgi:hypothetical protein